MTVLDRQPPAAEPPDKPRRRDRTHWLYIAVIVAVFAGVAVGILAPEVGKSVGVLGTMFVDLIKMMIAPVIFCTIVLGIGSVRKAATVGKVGGLAFVYFLVMSTFALAIGLRRRQPPPSRQRYEPDRERRRQGRRTGRNRARVRRSAWTSSGASSRRRCSRR